MIESLLFRNAWVRALLPLLFIGVVGVVSNTLVVELARGNQIDWSLLPHKPSFYYFVTATLVSALYQIALQRHDEELAKGFTPKQYEARIRNRVAEQVAKRSLKLIKDGDIEKLERETETFKRLYGENK